MRYVGATGQAVENEGQKVVDFVTRELEPRQMTFQCAPVNNMLACVAGVADAGNAILFMNDGGHVLKPDAEMLMLIRELVSKCKAKTHFDRCGNVYVLDAYVKLSKELAQKVGKGNSGVGGEHPGFPRQEAR